MSAHCDHCGHDTAQAMIVSTSVDPDAQVIDGRLHIDRAVMAEPDGLQVEAVCAACGMPRDLTDSEWRWA